jgi:hypothetical protein
MLISKLLKAKNIFTKLNGDVIIDLISSTFSFEKIGKTTEGFIRVKSEEVMRPDLVSVRIYSDQKYYELLLKYNGISNPFSIDENEILLAPSFKNLESSVVPPKKIVDKGAQVKTTNEDKLLNPKTVKDKKRLDALKEKAKEIVPPNINTSGNKNIKVRGGQVIFGEDVTQINKDNISTSIPRVRLVQQLTKSNLF